MKERNRVYVGVVVRYDEDGRMTPLHLKWKDGRSWPIEKVMLRQSYPLENSKESGLRFLVRIKGKDKLLFFDMRRWYVLPEIQTQTSTEASSL